MLDEPLGSLDRGLRERLVGELREILSRLAIPAIYVTHDQYEAFALADRVAILDAGAVVRTDTPIGLWAKPGTPFVARFLGLQNIIDGVRDSVGWVRTVLGTFGPISGSEGKATILVRDDAARLVPAPGPNIATGEVESAVFRGAFTQVRIANGSTTLEFNVPGDSLVPPHGTTVHIRAGAAEALEGES
jgi:ABC-type Fe3+/spermidine/putrescine transport system ATPase subunit